MSTNPYIIPDPDASSRAVLRLSISETDHCRSDLETYITTQLDAVNASASEVEAQQHLNQVGIATGLHAAIGHDTRRIFLNCGPNTYHTLIQALQEQVADREERAKTSVCDVGLRKRAWIGRTLAKRCQEAILHTHASYVRTPMQRADLCKPGRSQHS